MKVNYPAFIKYISIKPLTTKTQTINKTITTTVINEACK